MEGEREICDAVALNEELQAGVRGRRVREREREREGREEEGEEGGGGVRSEQLRFQWISADTISPLGTRARL